MDFIRNFGRLYISGHVDGQGTVVQNGIDHMFDQCNIDHPIGIYSQ